MLPTPRPRHLSGDVKRHSRPYSYTRKPFSIVVSRDGNLPIRRAVQVTCIIDGRQLSSATILPRGDDSPTYLETWVAKECGKYYDKNYQFSPIVSELLKSPDTVKIFLQDGPIPAELPYYGSIVVKLEEIKDLKDLPSRVVCMGKKPLGLLTKIFEGQTTDTYVDGVVVGKSKPTKICDGNVNKSAPKATVVFKVYIQYKGDHSIIKEYAPAHLTAKQTGNDPIDVVYIAVDEKRKLITQPFRIVAAPPDAHHPVDVILRSTIDGIKLDRNGTVSMNGSGHPIHNAVWCDRSSGIPCDMEYIFTPINFVDNGPIPDEVLLYGSIAVTLEGVKCSGDKTSAFRASPTKTPVAVVDSSMEDHLTDTCVIGTPLGQSKRMHTYSFKPIKSIPKATIVFKVCLASSGVGSNADVQYASRDVLIENDIIPDKLDEKAGHHTPPFTVFGGKTLKLSDTPLTVTYDHTEDAIEDINPGCMRWPRFLFFKKKQKNKRGSVTGGKGVGKKQ
ncbi:uncharacterized protein LOC62_04G006530 [Vanrija pseudolonga]|uniref:Uncharacterized protein n=1 Tax=Vanrija pseudolonga TaxID=143232 RepID=A0AAF1BJ62_9TREE|nr:hypothetical protein LOC62_04G006530 [Vanrija pseudolonga]